MPNSVLIVDDEPLVRRALARELGQKFVVVQAADFAEALEAYDRHSEIRAVVCDQDLGAGPRGSEFLERIKATAPDIVRVMVSGKLAEEENLSAALLISGTAQVCIRKPWSTGEVLEAVLNELRSRSSEMESNR